MPRPSMSIGEAAEAAGGAGEPGILSLYAFSSPKISRGRRVTSLQVTFRPQQIHAVLLIRAPGYLLRFGKGPICRRLNAAAMRSASWRTPVMSTRSWRPQHAGY